MFQDGLWINAFEYGDEVQDPLPSDIFGVQYAGRDHSFEHIFRILWLSDYDILYKGMWPTEMRHFWMGQKQITHNTHKCYSWLERVKQASSEAKTKQVIRKHWAEKVQAKA